MQLDASLIKIKIFPFFSLTVSAHCTHNVLAESLHQKTHLLLQPCDIHLSAIGEVGVLMKLQILEGVRSQPTFVKSRGCHRTVLS